MKKVDEFQESSVAVRETGTETTAAAHVSLQFFEYMTRLATAAMGPMAHLVVREQISALGESRDTFPHVKLKELIGMVSREILNETMKTHFQELMLQEIDTFKPFHA